MEYMTKEEHVHSLQVNMEYLPSQAISGASQVALVAKNPPANVGDIKDAGLIPESGRFPGGGHGNPLQYSSWKILWTEEPGRL